jgi:hypothetical protein
MQTHFRDVWSIFDQEATGFLHINKFRDFMIKLG